jgi:ribosome-associated protein
MPASKACVERTQIAARAAADKFGSELVALDLSDQSVLSEVFLIVTATNSKMIGSIADEVEEKLRLAGDKPLRRPSRLLRSRRTHSIDRTSSLLHARSLVE